MKYIVTGGSGFIGSNLIHILLADPTTETVVNYDNLTYAATPDNLKDIEKDPRYVFVKGDICNAHLFTSVLKFEKPDAILHLAAESHVDRSINSPNEFFETNLRGTFTLLEAIRHNPVQHFMHISTDEVYGSIESPYEATEHSPLNPSSPYSSAKAGSDLLALSYFKTFGLPIIVTRASNNYGRFQFPEKLIPLMILNALQDKPLPMYGNGMQIRDWLYVDDHCHAIIAALKHGKKGEIYNVTGTKSLPNIAVITTILELLNKPKSLIQTVMDRPGHDVRYAISGNKLAKETGWVPQVSFEDGMRHTIEWYKNKFSV